LVPAAVVLYIVHNRAMNASSSPKQDGCQALASTADAIAIDQPDIEPRAFIRELAHRVAGIDPGVTGVVDLAKGGENLVAGEGFREPFDDHSQGQARHFAGIAASVERFGATATLVAGETLGRDPPESADGKLSRAAVVFVSKLIDGELVPSDTGQWIRDHICEEAN
jgi:hypothetical protein